MWKYAAANVWKHFTDLFDYLPDNAVINNDTFCCRGGPSPSIEALNQLKSIYGRVEVPHVGAMCDLLWSVPHENQGWGPSPRGVGYTFGPYITSQCAEKNNLKMICRAHQLDKDGYSWNHDKHCVTIFSAPKYCYWSGNFATLMLMDE